MKGTAWVAVAGAAVVAMGLAPPRAAFSLAVLRRDGAVIPFASFDGGSWRNAWPAPRVELTVPINLDSVPKRWWGPSGLHDTWDAWVSGTPQTVHATQPTWVDVHCARHLALQTDYRSAAPAPPPAEQPYPKDGVAVYPPRTIDSIEILPVDGPAVRDLAPAMFKAFNQGERDTESRFGHPIVKRVREGIEPTIEAVYAFGNAPRFFYAEAVRDYREFRRRGDDCGTFAFGTGWFVQDAGPPRSLLTVVDMLRCDRVGASYMLPLGVVHEGIRTFWVAQFSGWHHERYAVIDLKPKMVELMISTWGGGC